LLRVQCVRAPLASHITGSFEQRSPVLKRLAVSAVYVLVLGALVVGTTAYVRLDKTVHISVDGKVTDVHSYAGSVGGVLSRAGIRVGVHDSLSPKASASVHDGSTITIRRGRELSLTVDGNTRQVWVTASSVQDALQQAGLRTAGAVVSADRSARVPLTGLSVDVDLPHTITVQVDGGSHVLVTTKATVADALAEAGITVNPADQVSIPLQTRPFDGLTVFIVRISSRKAQVSSPIPFTSVTKNDSTLLVGTKKVAQAGKNGTRVDTYELGIADGKQTSKTLISQQVTVQPVQQVILVGTKPKPKPKPVVYPTKADGLNWAALARCESGGRPTAVHGPFYGMYQFRLGTWRAVGGTGLPSDASASEQTYRAQLLYARSNWKTQWPTCGHYLFS
jgi:resuscitation-promoting factor RpfB